MQFAHRFFGGIRKKISIQSVCTLMVGASFAFIQSGCTTPSLHKPLELREIIPSIQFTPVWQQSLSGHPSDLFFPAQENEFVFAATTKGEVSKTDAITGKQIWSVSMPNDISAALTVKRGKILLADVKGTVHVLDAATGKIIWSYDLNVEILTPPVLSDDAVIVYGNNNRIYALDLLDGKPRWQQQHPAEKLSVRAATSMLTQGDKVFIGYGGGHVLALTAATGLPVWNTVLSRPSGSNELERLTMPLGRLQFVSGLGICAASYQGQLACVSPDTGEIVASKAIPTNTGVGFDGKFAYITDDRSVVHAVQLDTGKVLWKQEQLLYRRVSVPKAFQQYIIVGDYKGILHVLSNADGRFLYRIETDGSPIVGEPVVVTDRIVVQTAKGHLYAFKLEELK